MMAGHGPFSEDRGVVNLAQESSHADALWASADMIRHEEGSVSMPAVTEEIERHARVRTSYQDLSGVEKVEEADGLLSVCRGATLAPGLLA
jgi:Polypeptide deformylase